jgi:hypothetical protein
MGFSIEMQYFAATLEGSRPVIFSHALNTDIVVYIQLVSTTKTCNAALFCLAL